MKLKPIKVSMLNQYVKNLLKSNSIFYNLYVEGEISNIKISKTGYTFFTLKDESSAISCVCYYPDEKVADGDKVVVNGKLEVYEARGTYQIVVNNIEKTGLGNIFKELELLKAKLKERGLFDKNKEIPLLPSKIGVITSKNGAAVQDIIRSFNMVNAGLDIAIYDCLVQGESAKHSIIEAIEHFNNKAIVDIILIARGGGSSEDLKVFNKLEVAESIFMSKIPVVTGIGHDTDITLSDYTADVHCHTPTAAAEYIIRGYKNISLQLEAYFKELVAKTKNEFKNIEASLNTYQYILKTYNPNNIIIMLRNQCDIQKSKLLNHINNELSKKFNSLNLMYEKVLSHDYRKQLKNGYSLIFNKDNKLIKDIDNVNTGDKIKILFDKFSIEAEITKVLQEQDDIQGE